MMEEGALQQFIRKLSRLPGFGPRSARRMALYLLKDPRQRLTPLVEAMEKAAQMVRPCHICGNLDDCDPCQICRNPERQKGVICVVENVGDLWALERTHVYRGVYHVLGGTLSPIKGCGPEDINSASLFHRLDEGHVKEVILALGATVEGASTMHWLMDKMAQYGDIKITRMAQGIPMGGSLDVLDDGTLAAALGERHAMS